MRKNITCLLGLLLLAWAGVAGGNDVRVPGDRSRVGAGGFSLRQESTGLIEVRADSLSYSGSLEWADASGNVEVTMGPQVLRADQARLNSTTGEVEAWGNVELDRGEEGVWTGDRLVYNFKTRTGVTTGMVFDVPPFIARTEETTTGPDGKMNLQRPHLTTCIMEPGHEHYQIRARRAVLSPGEYVSMYGVTLRLFGVPLFYSPWLYRGLKEDQGWRFDPGYSSRMGAFLLSTYRRRLLEFEDDGWVRGLTRLDYRTKRGAAAGQGFEWQSPAMGEGGFSLYLLRDREPYGDDRLPEMLEENRYRLSARHSFSPSPPHRWQLRADYLSDVFMLRDFFEDDYRRRRQPDNILSYSFRGQDVSAGVLARFRMNRFYDQVERMPELWFDRLRRETAVEGLYHESQNRLAFLHRRHSQFSETEDYDAWRGDSAHMTAYPFKTHGFLNLTPRAGARVTYYSDTLRTRTETVAQEVPQNDQTQTNGVGQAIAVYEQRTVTESAGAALRLRLELGLEASFRAYRTFAIGERDWRHVVEPYINYTLVPEPNLTPDELYQFDSVDRLGEVHGIRLGGRNLLQTRTERGRVVNVADVDAYTDLRLARDRGQQALDRVFLVSRLFPDDWIRIDSRTEYSLAASSLVALDTRVEAWRDDRWSLSLEHIYREDRRNALTGGLTVSPVADWTYNIYARYDYHNGEIEEQGGFIQHELDCLAFRLGGYVQPGYRRDDGARRETDYRILFHVWLTAFPPDNLDRRYRQ